MDALFGYLEAFVTDYGYLAVFLLMAAESACIPIPSEVTMLVGGWYAARGQLDFTAVVAAGVLGNIVGSWVAYAIGRTTGRALLDRYGKFVLLRTHDIDKAEVWWEKRGEVATFVGRLLPVIRTFISLPAGMAKMPFWRFTIFTTLGVIPWTWGLTYLGVVVGHNWEKVYAYFDIPTLIIGSVLVITAVWWYLRRRKALALASAEADEGA